MKSVSKIPPIGLLAGMVAAAAKFGFIALLAQGVAATAAEVKVMAGAGMLGAFGELVPQFELATGHKIVTQYGGGANFKKQIEAGEAFDLVVIDAAAVDPKQPFTVRFQARAARGASFCKPLLGGMSLRDLKKPQFPIAILHIIRMPLKLRLYLLLGVRTARGSGK